MQDYCSVTVSFLIRCHSDLPYYNHIIPDNKKAEHPLATQRHETILADILMF